MSHEKEPKVSLPTSMDLDQAELAKAVEEYVASRLGLVTTYTCRVTFVVADAGVSAHVEMVSGS